MQQLFEAPQCIISTGGDKRLKVADDILRQMEKLDKPLVIVAITGLYRTGKSYLMNRLAGKSSGFALGSTIESKTKGIWIMARQHPHDANKYLVLLDTEGLGDIQKGDPNHDTWIFCLATLLSSVLVYNGLSAINDDAIGKLNFITEMSKHVKTKTNSQSGAENEFDKHFPEFIYAVRDFTLELEKDGKPITEDEYLESGLQMRSDKAEQYNIPRRCIQRYFKNRKCFTFDRPGARDVLKNLENTDDSFLSKNFIEDSNKFCEYIYKYGATKKLENGLDINGSRWVNLLTSYVDSIRKGDIPCIENAVVAIAKLENEKTIKLCVSKYIEEMKKSLSLPTPDEESFLRIHNDVQAKMVELFLSKVLCDSDKVFETDLKKRIGAECDRFKNENNDASKQKCLSILTQLEQSLKEKLSKGQYSCPGGYDQYSSDVNEIQRKYKEQSGLGVMKTCVLLEFIEEKEEEGKFVRANDLLIVEREKQIEIERQRAVEAEQNMKKIEEKLHKAQQDYDVKYKQLEAKQTEAIDKVKNHHEKLINQKLDEQKKMLKQEYEKKIEDLRLSTEKLQDVIKDMREQKEKEDSNREASIARMSRWKEGVDTQMEEHEKRLGNLGTKSTFCNIL